MMGDGATQVIPYSGTLDIRAAHQVVGYLYPGTGDVTVGNNPSPTDGTDISFMQHVIFLTIRP